MAIDISTDLIIQVDGAIQITPTVDDIYDVGGVPGQYDPGKDYSKTDNVSKNGQPVYIVNISLNSKTNQLYPLDKLSVAFAGAVDQPTTGTPVFFLNTNPDALVIVDDGVNTIAPGSATSPISVFTSGITSNSTLSTGVVVTLPMATAWKTKIQPKIVVVAEKDGITAQQTAPLPAVRMAPKTRYVSVLSAPNQNITFSPNAFQIPFSVLSAADRAPNQILPVIALTNPTDFSSVTYRIDLSAQVNAVAAAFDPNGFTFSAPAGFTVTSHSFTGGTLEYTVSGPFASLVGAIVTNVSATVPYTPSPGATNASVTLGGVWSAATPVSIAANNNYQILFELTQGGNANYNAPFVDLTQGGIGALRLRHVLGLNTINTPPPTLPQGIAATHDDLFYVATGSKYVLLFESPISGIKPNNTADLVQLIYTDLGGTLHTQTVNPSLYTQSFAYVGISGTVYDPNVVSHDVVTGAIPTGTYASVIAGGHKPDVRMITLTGDPWLGTNFDPMKEHTLQLNDLATDTMTGAEFAAYYAVNPQPDYITYWYSYVSLNTNLASPAAGYAAYGSLMAPMDSFEQRGSVFLNLGTLQKGQGKTVVQFNDTSTVIQFVGVFAWNGQVVYGITDEFGIPQNTIADYTKDYCLRLTAAVPNAFVFAQPIMKAGTPVILPIPDSLAPYFLLGGQPYASDPSGNRTPITNYVYDGHTISFTWPNVDTIMGGAAIGGMGGACFPIHFITPSKNVLVQPLQPTIPPEDLLLHQPGFVTDRMPSNTPFFRITYFQPPTTLVGLAVDNTGLVVMPALYPSGTSVRYTALVHNVNFDISDYYTFNTVPTNQYNEIETSNNTQPAFINSITIFDPTTEVYYQVAGAVTAQDIAMSKVLGGTPDLETYYNSTIKNTWIHWSGGPLPANVVMLSSFTPAVLKDDLVRVDYEVTVQMAPTTTQLYINDASFKYQSTGSGLEAHSNATRIQNMPADAPIGAVKSVSPSHVPSDTAATITFTVVYTLPSSVNTDLTTIINFVDVVNPALAVTGSSFSLIGGTFYTVLNLSAGNLIHYQLAANIPAGESGNIPLTATMTITATVPKGMRSCTQIPNQASISVNTQTPVLSNIVLIHVGPIQSLADLMESTALMQAGISHILNAEGEKLQAVIVNPIATAHDLLATNDSVEDMIKAVTRLEMILVQKLNTFPCATCCDE